MATGVLFGVLVASDLFTKAKPPPALVAQGAEVKQPISSPKKEPAPTSEEQPKPKPLSDDEPSANAANIGPKLKPDSEAAQPPVPKPSPQVKPPESKLKASPPPALSELELPPKKKPAKQPDPEKKKKPDIKPQQVPVAKAPPVQKPAGDQLAGSTWIGTEDHPLGRNPLKLAFQKDGKAKIRFTVGNSSVSAIGVEADVDYTITKHAKNVTRKKLAAVIDAALKRANKVVHGRAVSSSRFKGMAATAAGVRPQNHNRIGQGKEQELVLGPYRLLEPIEHVGIPVRCHKCGQSFKAQTAPEIMEPALTRSGAAPR